SGATPFNRFRSWNISRDVFLLRKKHWSIAFPRRSHARRPVSSRGSRRTAGDALHGSWPVAARLRRDGAGRERCARRFDREGREAAASGSFGGQLGEAHAPRGGSTWRRYAEPCEQGNCCVPESFGTHREVPRFLAADKIPCPRPHGVGARSHAPNTCAERT